MAGEQIAEAASDKERLAPPPHGAPFLVEPGPSCVGYAFGLFFALSFLAIGLFTVMNCVRGLSSDAVNDLFLSNLFLFLGTGSARALLELARVETFVRGQFLVIQETPLFLSRLFMSCRTTAIPQDGIVLRIVTSCDEDDNQSFDLVADTTGARTIRLMYDNDRTRVVAALEALLAALEGQRKAACADEQSPTSQCDHQAPSARLRDALPLFLDALALLCVSVFIVSAVFSVLAFLFVVAVIILDIPLRLISVLGAR